MSFSRIRTSGLWLDGSTFAGSEMETVDANLANAIDGLNGGAYALQNDLTIGGAPFVKVEIAIPLELDDNLLVHGGTFLYGTITAFGDISAGGAATFDGLTTFNGGVTFNGAVGFVGSLESFGNVGLYGNTLLGSGGGDILTVEAAATFNGSVSLTANTFIGAGGSAHVELNSQMHCYAPLSMQAGGYVKKALFQMTNSDVSRGPATPCSEVWVKDGVLTANRTFTIVDADNDSGIDFSTTENTYTVTVKEPGGANIAVLSASAGPFHYRSFKARRIAGAWSVTEYALP